MLTRNMSVISLALFAFGCSAISEEVECQPTCKLVDVCEEVCDPVLEQVGTELVCEEQKVEITDTICFDTEECLVESVCETETLCTTSELSYTKLECSTSEAEEECPYNGDNECPEWMPESDGNYYHWCFEFSDGWSGCGLSNSATASIHGMDIHISCSAEYDEFGYPDVGEPIQANGDPAVVDYFVSKYRVRNGECFFKKTCGNTEYQHEKEECQEVEVAEAFEVCIDDEDCWNEGTAVSNLTCEEVTLSKAAEVCVEVPVYKPTLDCNQVCELTEVCEESDCTPDNEWLSGGGPVGSN